MVPHAGPDSKIFREICELGAILQQIGDLRGSVVERARIALLFDHDSANAIRLGTMPSTDLNALPVARRVHAALVRRGYPVDVIESRDDLDGYDVIIVPTLYLISDEAAARIADRAADGAQVLVTGFSGIVDPICRVRLGGHPGAFRELLGVRMEEFYPLQAGERVRLENGWTGEVWSELGEVTDAEVITRYADGVLGGRPAITRRITGSGSATYVSTWLTEDQQWADLIHPLLGRAGIEPVVAGDDDLERVRRVATDGSGRSWLFVLNHRDTAGTVQVTGRELITGSEADGKLEIGAGGVAVIQER
jgi:beta-galactosidase